jgi:Flp pilus assembly protein TadG
MTNRFAAPMQARRGDPRGQVLVLFALMLVVLLLVSALAVDYGGWLVTKRNYQNVSDAAALAGAQQLTRPLSTACPSGASKNFCARQAAWESVQAALRFTGLNPATQANTSLIPSSTPYQENGYTVWVASPPSDAGSAYVGHVSGPGNIYVRVDHAGTNFLSGIAGINRKVQAWSTAGRFPANFAVIGMCSPTSITTNCLAGDSNIKLDGTTTNLIVNTGDLGTNRWARDGGSSSGVALGADSNAYMQLFDSCWSKSTNQCQLWSYSGGVIDTSSTRSAIPLGAPIPDPSYLAPTINATTAPNECRGTGSVQLASVQVLDRTAPDAGTVANLPIELAAAVGPQAPQVIQAAGKPTLNGFVRAQAAPQGLLNGISVSATPDGGPNTTGAGSNGNGEYHFTVNGGTPAVTYTITATDPTGVYHTTTTTQTVGTADATAPTIFMQKNPTISGTIRSSLGGTISGATVSITGSGGPYNTTSGAGGAYGPIVITGWGATNTWNVNASATFYTSNFVNSGTLALDTNTVIDVTLTPAPASLTGTLTDAVTGLPIPNVTVTLSGTNSGSTTTNSSGTYTFGSVAPGAGTVITLTNNLDGYMAGSPTSPTNPTTQSLAAGANTVNFAMWPKGCGTANGDKGNWSCNLPSGGNCPATINQDAANVTCTFTQANAIRPGTYTNITLPNNTCAWLDPKGGATGLAAGQSAGIYHIKGTISMGSNSYLFGDGVTIVMDQGSNLDVNNGGGFVLNFGSVASGSPLTCDLSTIKNYNDGFTPCFRTVPTIDGQDYAYAAWTTKAHAPWTSATFPTYNDSVVQKGQELGITFFMYGSGLGNNSRMKLATANMGYLFNGVLYGPNDDIQLGGGKDGQSAAGQIVGWTIEYHGGTRILQNWYGDPVDGQPFLIEPILGE